MRLSELFNNDVLVRDADVQLTHYSDSPFPGTICFVLTEQYLALALNNPNIVAVITNQEYSDKISKKLGLIVCDNVKRLFFELHNYMFEREYMCLFRERFVDPSAKISDTAIVGKYVKIYKNVVIDHNAIINDFSIIEDGAYIGPNVVIGAKGLRNTLIDNLTINVQDAGGVFIGKNCEILCNAVIQKSFNCEYTTIGDNAKISVNANIGHGCKIGERTLISGNAQIAGNVRIGNDVWIGPSVTTAENIKIGNKAQIKLGSVVVKNVNEGEVISGNFAVSHSLTLKAFAKAQQK